jgi:hypothetical protein
MKKFLLLLTITISLNAYDLPSYIYKKHINITPESNYQTYRLMSEGKKAFAKGKLKEATNSFLKALKYASSSKGSKNIDQYDYLFANYGILTLLKNQGDKQNYQKLSKHLISFLNKITKNGKDIWEEGELGKFQLYIYKNVSNDLAKLLYQESERKDKKLLKEALYYSNISQKFIRSDEDNYLKKTKAMIENAIEGNPPLKDEKEIQIIKIINKDQNSTKKGLKK